MGSCMVAKFEKFVDLNDDEKKLLLRLEETKENYRAGQTIISKGEKADKIFVISDGWSFISTTIDHDIRSIFDVRLDGDISGISELSYDKYLYDLVALTDVEVCPFPRDNLNEIFKKSEKLCRTFYSILSREQAILYERIVSLGRRTALEKVAHFIIEISVRLSLINSETQKQFSFPITQEDMSDVLGLSSIHINRSMNELKRHKYVEYDRTNLNILDYDRLITLANFNDIFLQDPKINWHDA